jgi:hypothetical protein
MDFDFSVTSMILSRDRHQDGFLGGWGLVGAEPVHMILTQPESEGSVTKDACSAEISCK